MPVPGIKVPVGAEEGIRGLHRRRMVQSHRMDTIPCRGAYGCGVIII
jgi:hypothetical protein